MKLTHLRDLVTAAQRGGFRRAARHLGIAQPAITRSIRELERELGATLFERGTTGVVLTPIGQAFFRRSVAIQLELERACDEVKQLQGIATGAVAIGLSTSPHMALLPQVIEPFRRRYPDVLLNISEGLFPAMEAGLRNGSIDFYVGPLSEHHLTGEFSSEKLFDNRRIVLARPGHPLADARSLTELADASWVTTSVTENKEAELNPVFDKYGLPPPKIAVQAHSALTVITVAASSDLLAMLPQQCLRSPHAIGRLEQIAVREQLTAPSIFMVTRSLLPLTPVAEHLSDLLRRAALHSVDPILD
ncbi:MAG TPA: LysR substrate-binding domain-containing protein [Alphaproteobacteria bacterium]|nr:LysR substrate-binding domain-containing protein [Alphaproteobacteria bacterium]